jgi:hypothetical protein
VEAAALDDEVDMAPLVLQQVQVLQRISGYRNQIRDGSRRHDT